MLDETGLDHVLGRLEAELAEEGGVLDRIYFVPTTPTGDFRTKSQRSRSTAPAGNLEI